MRRSSKGTSGGRSGSCSSRAVAAPRPGAAGPRAGSQTASTRCPASVEPAATSSSAGPVNDRGWRDDFSALQQRAAALRRIAQAAGSKALQELHAELGETLGLSGSIAWGEAANTASQAAGRAAAQSFAEGAQRRAALVRLAPQAAAACSAPLAGVPLSDPDEVVVAVSEALESLRVGDAASKATALVLSEALDLVRSAWDTAGPGPGAGAAVAGLVLVEVARLELSCQSAQSRWSIALENVVKDRSDFQMKGFPEKAACCEEVRRQMVEGLRGFVVQRALRASAAGIEALRRSGDAAGRCVALTADTAELKFVARARADAVRRIDGMVLVVERGAKDAEHWSMRGQLPDGEVAPPPLEPELEDLWASVSEAAAVESLLSFLDAQVPPESGEALSDMALASVKRLGALSKFAGETRETVEEALRVARGARVGGEVPERAAEREAWQRASAALATLIQQLSSFEEGLLELLDGDDAAEASAWASSWAAGGEGALAAASETLLSTGSALAAAPVAVAGGGAGEGAGGGTATATASATAGGGPGAAGARRALLLAVRGLATLAGSTGAGAEVRGLAAGRLGELARLLGGNEAEGDVGARRVARHPAAQLWRIDAGGMLCDRTRRLSQGAVEPLPGFYGGFGCCH